MENMYAVAVRLKEYDCWTIHGDPNGERFSLAKGRLRDCVESYGKANTRFYLVVRYGFEWLECGTALWIYIVC